MHYDENYTGRFLLRVGPAGAGRDAVGFSAQEKLMQFALTPARGRHRVVRQWQ